MDRHQQQICKMVKEKRIARGISQAALAKTLGYTSGQYCSNWELGINKFPEGKLKKLCAYFILDRKQIAELLLASKSEQVHALLGLKKKALRKRNK